MEELPQECEEILNSDSGDKRDSNICPNLRVILSISEGIR
jgi:hypothetical protein